MQISLLSGLRANITLQKRLKVLEKKKKKNRL